ncbi:MAG: proline--tRNA ligase [Candidatus Woesearchaeota archaeon]
MPKSEAAKERKTDEGITANKEKDFSEWYQQVLIKGELIDYSPVSGCYVMRPTSYAIWERIQSLMDEKFKEMGVRNVYFPMLIPESLLKKESEHVAGFSPEVAWVTQGGDKQLPERLAIRPTSETIMYALFAKWIRSHRDLPLKINQWCNIVRWEFRDPVPFLRAREFLWQEGHTVFATKEEAEKETFQILQLYRTILEDFFSIPVIAGRKSEKEKFAGAEYTLSLETFLPNGKAIQCCTSHHLGQRFGKAFGIEFFDADGNKKYPWQNSWGLSTRTIGIMVMMHSDNKGLVIPPKLSPLHAVIVPIYYADSKKSVLSEAKMIAEDLKKAGFNILVDEREEYTPGWKFNEWELHGVPLRLEIGPKDVEKKQVVIVRRDNGEREAVKVTELRQKVTQLLETIQKALFEKAKSTLTASIFEAKDWNEFVAAIEGKKLVRAAWCEKVECEEQIKTKTGGAKSVCIPLEQPNNIPNKKCIHCENRATVVAFFAKSY